ncbi:MAG: hypothetical protein GWN58_24425 [Anaerolineae bacterium]|nr:hypothetical protein [Anaerolineae bacterium]
MDEERKDPRELAKEAGLDVIAVADGNGGHSRFLVWGYDLFTDRPMSLHVPREAWLAALSMTARVGTVHGQECVIFE